MQYCPKAHEFSTVPTDKPADVFPHDTVQIDQPLFFDGSGGNNPHHKNYT